MTGTRVPAWPTREQVAEAEQAFLLAGDVLAAHAEAFHGGVLRDTDIRDGRGQVIEKACPECARLAGYEARTADRYGALFQAEQGAWLVA